MSWKEVAVVWGVVAAVCFVIFRFSSCLTETDKVNLDRHRASVAADAEIQRARLDAEQRGTCVCH